MCQNAALTLTYTLAAAQFGHLFAKAATREAAIRAMVAALREVRIRGEIRTTTDYVCNALIQPIHFHPLTACDAASLTLTHTLSAVQFGHLFAKAATREAAIRAMVAALREVRIRGEIRTTTDYVCDMIQTPDFVGNQIHTGWLDSRIASHVSVTSGARILSLRQDAGSSLEWPQLGPPA